MPRVSSDQIAARRRQILDGARTCFADHGYEGATVRRLEQSTGLSRGAIFHYFRDKDALFLALAEDDARRMADVVAERGLVEVMRGVAESVVTESVVTESVVTESVVTESVVTESSGTESTGPPPAIAWLGTRLEVSRRLRTDPEFRARWQDRSAALSAATRERLERQAATGALRDDVPVAVLARYLELVFEGLISHLAMGLPAGDLDAVLDVVEHGVRAAAHR